MSVVSPLEIAFLVLGFLKEEKYKKTYDCFLKECQHLSAKANPQIVCVHLKIIPDEVHHL